MIFHKHAVKLIGQMEDSPWVKKKKKDTTVSIWSGMKTILVVQQDGVAFLKQLPITVFKKRDESAALFCFITHFKVNTFSTLTTMFDKTKF